MILALELYNRPSLENKMDAFVMCFCTAWEQFLKARIIEQDGEKTIFRSVNKKELKKQFHSGNVLTKFIQVNLRLEKH
ncbi:DUF3644 domain-containing protein [Klebsiella sp. B345]|uniref:DUF3644 domain-containing protein n=1 Tax=Klebsiella sp. B345 TaxID=2755398 RepID=UPI003DA83D1C